MKRIGTILCTISLLLCTACSSNISASTVPVEKEPENIYSAALPGEYDSTDTSVISKISEINSTITFYNFELERYYTLSYDSITKMYDKYGAAISVSQLKKGEVVDIEFLKSSKLLAKLTESKEAFYISDITGFMVDAGAKTFTIGTDVYKVTDKTALLGVESGAGISDFDSTDNLTISGFGFDIYGIVLESGHGGLKLNGDEYFEGGFLEIGTSIIKEIEPDMRVTLREGEYDVKVSKNLTEYKEHVVIERGKDFVVDLSEVEIVLPKTGKVMFEVTPANMLLYVDDTLVDSSKMLEYEYGMHYLIASADGYKTEKKYFKVAEESKTLEIELEAMDSGKEEEKESNTGGYYITISSPAGAEVFFDGNYKGLSPISIDKVAGSHTLTLKKAGYVDREYTLQIENTAENVYYSFGDLAAETIRVTGDVSKNE